MSAEIHEPGGKTDLAAQHCTDADGLGNIGPDSNLGHSSVNALLSPMPGLNPQSRARDGGTATVPRDRCASDENGGILSRHFSQYIKRLDVTTQLVKRAAVEFFWMVVVVCGCLASVGIGFSTISAQLFGTAPQSRNELCFPAGILGPNKRRIVSGRSGPNPSGAGKDGDEAHQRCGSYARYSSDNQRDTSIADQQRLCREMAERSGATILSPLEFADAAVSGTKLHREGLDRMLAAATSRQIDVLYFHSLSRLARESVITMPMLKKLVYVDRVRVISVTEGIDSLRTEWEVLATIFSIQHERYVKELSANVFRGQEGTVLNGYSVGDYCFGYTSEPVPGTETGRRGRNAQPRMRYVIDPDTAPWVVRVFHWFVTEKRSLGWIARELTRLKAPKDHRATTANWHCQLVTKLLRRRKYIGIWPWGEKKNIRNPLTGDVHQEDRSPEETEKWVRRLPHLQIVDSLIFVAAQVRLDENAKHVDGRRRPKGQLGGSVSGNADTSPRHLLTKLLKCELCRSAFHVGGTRGTYLNCSSHRTGGGCTCKTQVLRTVAEKVILNTIGQRVLADPAWREEIHRATLAANFKLEAELPSAIKDAESALAAIKLKINHLLDQVEDGQGGPEINSRLSARREENRDLEQQLERLRQRDDQRMPEPTAEWIDQQILKLGEILASGGPAAALALRALVGGEIWVREIELPHSDRKRLEARFTIRTAAVVNAVIGSSTVAAAEEGPTESGRQEEIIVELREPDVVEQIGEQVAALWKEGLTLKQIAERVGRNRNLVKDALLLWHEQHGLPVPNTQETKGRRQSPTLAEVLMDRIMGLWHGGMPHREIAAACDCDMSIVTTAVKLWHEQRNLPVPDGRTRRKMLRERAEASAAGTSNGTSSESPQAVESEKNGVQDRELVDPPTDAEESAA